MQQEPRKKGKGRKGKRRGKKEVEGRKEPALRRWKRRRGQQMRLKRSSPSGTRKSSSCRSGSHVKKIPECWTVRGMRPEKQPMYLLLDMDFTTWGSSRTLRSGGVVGMETPWRNLLQWGAMKQQLDGNVKSREHAFNEGDIAKGCLLEGMIGQEVNPWWQEWEALLGTDLNFWSWYDPGHSGGLVWGGNVKCSQVGTPAKAEGMGLLLEGGGKLGEFFPDDLFPQWRKMASYEWGGCVYLCTFLYPSRWRLELPQDWPFTVIIFMYFPGGKQTQRSR